MKKTFVALIAIVALIALSAFAGPAVDMHNKDPWSSLNMHAVTVESMVAASTAQTSIEAVSPIALMATDTHNYCTILGSEQLFLQHELALIGERLQAGNAPDRSPAIAATQRTRAVRNRIVSLRT